MGNLSPIAFDIETSGLEPGADITVVGLATDMGVWLALNTAGREAEATRLANAFEYEYGSNVCVSVFQDERGLLVGLGDFASNTIEYDRHYLEFPDGETFR